MAFGISTLSHFHSLILISIAVMSSFLHFIPILSHSHSAILISIPIDNAKLYANLCLL